MPFALTLIGLVMVITGVRGTYADFGAQLRKDFTGPGNFTYWAVSIAIIGGVGYVERLRPVSNAFLALVMIALLLANKGFFAQFKSALQQGPTSTPNNPQAANENAPGLNTADISAIVPGVALVG